MHAFYASIPTDSHGSAQCAPLTGYQVLQAGGADALSFLHGQLTQDVTSAPADAARFGGYCTAKGRLLATMVFWRTGAAEADAPQCYGLVRADLAQGLLKRLSMFVLRAKVKLSLAPLHVAGVQTADPAALSLAAGGPLPLTAWQRADLPSGTWIAAPSAHGFTRWWWIASDAQLDQAGSALAQTLVRMDTERWHADDLAAGLPWINAATQDAFIPQTVNLDLIGGVSFTKGCYPGQEVVARSHYRGTVKRRMFHGVVAGASAPLTQPLPGTDIYDAANPGEACGRVVDASSCAGELALLFETALGALNDGDLRLGAADGPRITLRSLPYDPNAR